MRVHVDAARTLRFDDGTPVTAASGVSPLADGWIVVQDDSTIAAWRRPGGVVALRVCPPVEGLDTCARWCAEVRPLQVAVNVSARKLVDERLVGGVLDPLAR